MHWHGPLCLKDHQWHLSLVHCCGLWVSEGPSVAAALDVSTSTVMSEGPSVAAELDGWAWPMVPEKCSVVAELPGWA